MTHKMGYEVNKMRERERERERDSNKISTAVLQHIGRV